MPQKSNATSLAALVEDIGGGDLTALLTSGNSSGARMAPSSAGRTPCSAGTDWFNACFRQLDPPGREIRWHAADGARIHAGQTLCEIEAEDACAA
jgi:nicotinate-nucleotide pyrophosphorylase